MESDRFLRCGASPRRPSRAGGRGSWSGKAGLSHFVAPDRIPGRLREALGRRAVRRRPRVAVELLADPVDRSAAASRPSPPAIGESWTVCRRRASAPRARELVDRAHSAGAAHEIASWGILAGRIRTDRPRNGTESAVTRPIPRLVLACGEPCRLPFAPAAAGLGPEIARDVADAGRAPGRRCVRRGARTRRGRRTAWRRGRRAIRVTGAATSPYSRFRAKPPETLGAIRFTEDALSDPFLFRDKRRRQHRSAQFRPRPPKSA